MSLISVLILATCSAALGQVTITANATSFKNRDYVLVSGENPLFVSTTAPNTHV